MKSHDDVANQLRELVEYEPQSDVRPTGKTKRSFTWVKWLGYVVAAAIVLASIAVMVAILASELTGDDESEVVVATETPPPTVAAGPQATSTAVPTTEAVTSATDTDSYRELRYLVAGSEAGTALQSVLRLPDTAPLAAFGRTSDEGSLTGLILVDSSDQDFGQGIGVLGPEEVEIDGQPGLLTGTGPELSHMVDWEHQDFGPLRAWGLGTSADEHVDLVEQLVTHLIDPATALPDSWATLARYEPGPPDAVWRAYYASSDLSEFGVVTTTHSAQIQETCSTDTDSACSNLDSRVDDDGVTVTTMGSARSLQSFASSLRPVTQNNAQIRSNEFEPLQELPLDRVRSQLFVPGTDSEWQVAQTFAHSSGRKVAEHSLVLIERSTPVLGFITSTAVVNVLPLGAAEPVAEELPGGRNHLIVERDDALIEVLGWNHELGELRLVEQLVTLTDEGVDFASRAGGSIGLERRYEAIYSNPFPRSIVEGPVFAAVVTNDAGSVVQIRVSRVPSYEPAAAAVLEHENQRIEVPVRGQTASVITTGQGSTLQWEEKPGTLIALTGPTQADVIEVARTLEAVNVADLVVDTP